LLKNAATHICGSYFSSFYHVSINQKSKRDAVCGICGPHASIMSQIDLSRLRFAGVSGPKFSVGSDGGPPLFGEAGARQPSF